MTDPMQDALDTMLAKAQAEEAGETSPDTLPAPEETPPEPVDPLAHLIGTHNPDADRDPFSMLLDGMLAEEGLCKDTPTEERKRPEFEEHEWEFKKEMVFEDDDVEVICKKCFRQMRMSRQQTNTEAMATHKINPDCGLGTVGEVMDS